jgi:predicted nucleic acid-binding protein
LTLVDTNILVDILANNPVWMSWSAERLEECARVGALIINDVIYSEVSIGFETEGALIEKLGVIGVVVERVPASALFLAGKAYLRYRVSGGSRTSVLPDFFIGAHAQVAKLPVLTRDTRRFRTYFPDVQLLTPEG